MELPPLKAVGTEFESDLPSRLDRLVWSPWHWRVVLALGVTWILDGLEVTIVGSVASVLREPQTLNLSETQIGAAASAYLLGAVLGSLIFGRLTDQMGRKRMFLVTLSLYLGATLLTAFSWNFWSFAFFRAATGAGIGGEASAMNSAIDELLPARVRGRVDLIINGTYWGGTALGAALTLILLNSRILPHSIGWRLCFGFGAILGVSILIVRRHLPESPRWLLLHGRLTEAEAVVKKIENTITQELGTSLPPPGPPIKLRVRGAATFSEIIRVLFKSYRRRSILAFAMMISQSFAYNAIFFTFALVLSRFYQIPPERVGLFVFPFSMSNLLGPILLGHFFDSVGRRIMIAMTYSVSGLFLIAVAFAFMQGWLTAFSQTVLWCVVFFFASAAASSAYLTVSELFPIEMRGMAIALFYAAGIAVGGVGAPTLFSVLIQTGNPSHVSAGYFLGALLMLGAAVVALVFGVAAERKSLEEIAQLGDLQSPQEDQKRPVSH